jgi:hypothetical protein
MISMFILQSDKERVYGVLKYSYQSDKKRILKEVMKIKIKCLLNNKSVTR